MFWHLGTALAASLFLSFRGGHSELLLTPPKQSPDTTVYTSMLGLQLFLIYLSLTLHLEAEDMAIAGTKQLSFV